ncbi:BC1872 family protein [Paenibacillus ottowii]
MEFTRDNIKNAEVGPELDSLVGTFVTKVAPEIKWWVMDDAETIIYDERNYESDARDALNKLVIEMFDTGLKISKKELYRNYSTSISDAFNVLEIFKDRGYLFTVKNLGGGDWEVSLTDWDGQCDISSAQATTPAEAICRAGLRAALRKQERG